MKDIKDIVSATNMIERTLDHISRLGIFKYDTLDEADPKKERVRGDVTVEIGGPSTHIKFAVLTRAEHTLIKEAVTTILNNRMDRATEKLNKACDEFTGK